MPHKKLFNFWNTFTRVPKSRPLCIKSCGKICHPDQIFWSKYHSDVCKSQKTTPAIRKCLQTRLAPLWNQNRIFGQVFAVEIGLYCRKQRKNHILVLLSKNKYTNYWERVERWMLVKVLINLSLKVLRLNLFQIKLKINFYDLTISCIFVILYPGFILNEHFW